MTLFKQIALFVSLAFLLLFILINVDNLKQSGLFLSGQLQTSAQDMATVMAISISTTGSGQDIAALETLFNAVFDSGYYSEIRLVDTDGNILHEKQRELAVQGVPDWFISAVPLSSVKGSAQVMQGWSVLGMVELTLHPGFAYASLYSNLVTSLLWFFALFLMVLFLLWYVLHILLKPLKAINKQADAIHDNHFIKQTVIPNTVELRRVVQAMNRLVAKVQQIFIEQEQTLDRYNTLLYVDSATGLYNRRYMLAELEKALSEETASNSYLVIIKLQDLSLVREQHGYEKADSLVEKISDIIQQKMTQQANKKYARMNDDEFAFLFPYDKPLLGVCINEILMDAKKQINLIPEYKGVLPSVVAGIADVHDSANMGEVLAKVDLALSQASVAGPYQYKYSISDDLELPQGKMQWRNWLQQAIDENKFYLVSQPVQDRELTIVQQEVFIRINDNKGKVIPAGIFMPMLMSLGYGLDIDRAVFKLLEELGENKQERTPLAVNLSDTFFSHVDAFDELEQLIKNCKEKSITLCIETTHATLQQYPEMCMQIANTIKNGGQYFGIDNFDLNNSVQILQTLRPDYIKVNARILDDISGDEVSAAYQALRTLTKTLDIKLMAVGVDKQVLYDRLLELNIDAVQGNLLGKPKVIK